jgi:16S rRNA (cytosine967-C5)-methyltransferase
MSDGLDPRRCAARAYDQVLTHRRTLEGALNADHSYRRMEARDRGFARAITATALRRKGQIESVLATYLSKPLDETAEWAQALLATGTAQLLWLETPAHAVVSTAVELAQEQTDTRRLKGMINAVLRRVAEGGPDIVKRSAQQINLPDWIRQSWRRAYGPAHLGRIADAVLKPPPLDITVKNPAETEKWAEALNARILPTGTLRCDEIGDVTALPGFEEGAWWVQDAAAALPARLINVDGRERIVDLCAAPGGKTMQLAAAGALVTAIDLSESRLERVNENLARTGLEARVIATDGRGWTPKRPVDAVLLDAPCTATGTLRRHPETVWLKEYYDVPKMQELQLALVKSAVKMLRPGGRLVVCTCSLQPEEGEDLAAIIAKTHKDLIDDPILPEEVPGLESTLTRSGHFRSTPAIWMKTGGLDGFFIARYRKRD